MAQVPSPESGLDNKTEKKMLQLLATFICNHVKTVRQCVKDHPRLFLVEFDIYDDNTGRKTFGKRLSVYSPRITLGQIQCKQLKPVKTPDPRPHHKEQIRKPSKIQTRQNNDL